MTDRHILLSKSGGDRATGYTMNNKIVSLPEGYLCTWLDSRRQNRWALVGSAGDVIRSGTIGQPGLDNHCGAALAKAGDQVHAMIGGHHGPLEHHVLDGEAWVWRFVDAAGERATYPSAAADLDGHLHVFYRCGGQERWTLNYARLEDGEWTEAVPLVRAHKPGYVYWTNGVTVGPDGTVHVALGNPQVRDDGSVHYGASHICSTDGGRHWRSADEDFGDAPIAAESIPYLGDAGSEDRRQPKDEQKAHEAPGPTNYNYQNMNLSNPVTDVTGALHVVLHHNRRGTADLWTLAEGAWSRHALTKAVLGNAGYRIHPQSSLSMDAEGTLYVGLMVEPADGCVWGPPGTHLVRATVRGQQVTAEPMEGGGPDVAQWLPAFEHPPAGGLDHTPAMIHTRGVNAGGFGNNQNDVDTEVWLTVED